MGRGKCNGKATATATATATGRARARGRARGSEGRRTREEQWNDKDKDGLPLGWLEIVVDNIHHHISAASFFGWQTNRHDRHDGNGETNINPGMLIRNYEGKV